uniref:Thyroglobulin n=1 Tax=Oncorhynchus tshawytscha TaxID=74940 RepID=A0AAZ3SN54_ONCTS
MMSLVQISFMLLCYLCLSEGKISEYQLESETLSQCESLRGGSSARQQDHVPQCSEDGRFRHVQCSGAGGECWCVNAEGAEISGSRQNGSAVYCLTSCQLHRQQALLSGDAPLVPQCQASGEYQAVQCDSTRGQCWCVDLEGMELYGTRQNGKPSQCPGSCEVRSRRLLHGVGERSPPQCSADGSFLSVQCKFVNSTDRMVLDLLHTFNRFPKVFQTFSSFRQMFPEVSSYCFCADSRGRELPSTGVELLLDEVYDTAFSGLESGRSFSQTNMYRILQRRFLAIQLAMSGRFRCPSPCESERSAGALAGNVFVASCASDGGYVPTQCQAGGQCWCVDQTGKEIFGTRQHGGHPDCAGVKDCTSERRQALSRLFSSPSGQVPSAKDSETHPVPSPLSPCSPQLQQLLLGTLGESLSERSDLGDILAETIQGMFPSGAMALKALSLASNPKRLQENLFGGKFLGNAGMFNFTGAVGVSGTLSFSQASLANNQDLVQLISAILENGDFLSTLRQTILLSKAEDSTQLGSYLFLPSRSELFRVLFESAQSGGAGCEREPSALYVPSCDDSGQYQEIQCQGSECWCADRQGQEVTGSRFNGQRPRCPSRCERELNMFNRMKSLNHLLLCPPCVSLGPSWCQLLTDRGQSVVGYEPECQVDGRLFSPLQCDQTDCWCVSQTDGQELPGTRTPRGTGKSPACDSPQCPSLFSDITVTYGDVVCRSDVIGGQQNCDLICHLGYESTLPVNMQLLCDVETRAWVTEAPLPQACQRLQVLQTVQTSVVLQLTLPPGQGPCSSSLHSSLQTSLLHDMRAQGLCSLQLTSVSVSVCDESSVSVECESEESVSVQVSWRALLSDLPVSVLPDLHDIGKDGGVCSPCPQGSYQDQEGSDFCTMCPEGTSTNGASTATQCLTECQRSGLRCSEGGDFLSAQQDIQTRRWRCVTSSGEQLEWTTTGQPLVCVCYSLQAYGPWSKVIHYIGNRVQVLTHYKCLYTKTTSVKHWLCLCHSPACAQVQTCLYVVLYAEEGQSHCELYSTDAANIRCQTSEQVWDVHNLSFSPSTVWTQSVCLCIIGHEFTTEAQKTFERLSFLKASSGVYRTMVFAAEGTTLTDVHRFCQDECTQNTCCDGFILNQNVLSGGTIMCGLLSYPDMLLCSEADWDVSGLAKANRICGAGVTYNKLQKQFIFNFGGQDFTISIYLWKGIFSLLNSPITRSQNLNQLFVTLYLILSRPVDAVKETFVALDSSAVVVDSERDIPSLHYWIFKHQFSAQEAQLWCLKRCEEEELCHLADVRDESSVYFTCALYPDTQVCGAYDKPLRQACSPVLPQQPHTAHTKKVDLTGSVESFYSRVPFKKMVSYSVRSQTLGRCQPEYVLCLTLNSFGIQTCGEGERTTWRVQDCTPSKVETGVYPLGWYEKPGVCKRPRISRYRVTPKWHPIPYGLLVKSSEAESCVVVSVGRTDSAVRCVLYPDTLACGPSTTTTGGQDCRLVIRESALQVYLHKEPKAALTSVFIPAHGTLQGSAVTTLLGSDRKTVRQFLGVPYARPPIRALRFVPPQPAEWSGTWIATVTRPSCLQPGAVESSASSEDCLYLNIFVPSGIVRSTAVLVFFHNPSGAASDDTASLLDGSYLAAVGNIVVVTVNTRVAAFGFLSTGSTALPGNAGFQDQVAALKWVQENIEAFGGDPRLVTVGAERSGGDVASLHLTSPSSRGLFDRMLLMGGSVFSPASVLSVSKAQGQAEALARELGCPPSSDPEQLGSCLRAAPAQDLNAAQTKLLSVSGPLQAWGPVVDGVSVQGKPSMALMNAGFHRADLLLGSSAEDGLISRAKRIKNFEELQGRADSKTAFYEALSNSLGGDEANAFVKAAATWFYSMQHSPSPAGYNLFSQALNSATRDLFIVCPTIKMANFWAANTRSNVFMYYLPEDTAQTSADLSVPLDVHYAFGLPHSPLTYDLFTNTERRLSLQMMTYMANFIKSGNPNQAHRVSRVAFSEAALPPWHAFQSHPEGDSYMEVEPGLSNHRGLRRPQCSFWADYVPSLTASTGGYKSKLKIRLCKSSVCLTNHRHLCPKKTE